jgi:uncharacterized protein
MILYLHGFASSSHSGKATYLRERLRERGLELHTPDLNLPDFSHLTVTRMLERTREAMEGSNEPATLIGSSLGAFVAVNAAAKWPDRVSRLVLLAPALDFSRAREIGGVSIEEWRRAGQINVFHFGYGRMMPIGYTLYADAAQYDVSDVELRMPVLAFHGRRDTVVEPASVEAWCRRRPNVELHMLDDDHQLAASLSYIWEKLAEFLSIGEWGNRGIGESGNRGIGESGNRVIG